MHPLFLSLQFPRKRNFFICLESCQVHYKPTKTSSDDCKKFVFIPLGYLCSIFLHLFCVANCSSNTHLAAKFSISFREMRKFYTFFFDFWHRRRSTDSLYRSLAAISIKKERLFNPSG